MKKIIFAFIASAAVTATAFADTENTAQAVPAYTTSGSTAGFYISGNMGYSKVAFQNQNVPAKDLRGFALMTNVGYQFCRYVALELSYADFHAPSNAEASGWSLLGKGIYPLHDQFDAFGKAGVMRLHTKDVFGARKDSVVPEFGVGAAYNVNDNIAVSVQGLMSFAASNQVPATYAAYAGASYKFTV